jgi:hypothetical protein
VNTVDRSSCPATRHGTSVAYRANGCRCDDAREDQYHFSKARRLGRAKSSRQPSIGYARRTQSLMAIGWPLRTQATISGVGLNTLWQIPRHPWVSTRTAKRVLALFTDLYNSDGPSTLTEWRAWLAGYPPPSAWTGQDIDDPAAEPVWPERIQVDRVAVERVARGRGDFAALNGAEQAAAYQLARRTKVSDRRMSQEWHVSLSTLKTFREVA